MDENADHQQKFSPRDTLSADNRKRKGSSGVSPIIPPFVWLSLIFVTGLLLGNLLWSFTADVLAFNRGDEQVEVTISTSDSMRDISRILKQNGLVDHAWLFRLYARLTDAQSTVKPGTYTLSTRYDYHALVKALSAGTVQRTLSLDLRQGDRYRKWLNWNY